MNNEPKDKVVKQYIASMLAEQDLDKYERATLLKDFIQQKSISVRQCAKQFGKDESTIRKFLLVSNIPEKQYRELKESGISHEKICQKLKSPQKYMDYDIKHTPPVDFKLREAIRSLKPFITKPNPSSETESLRHELVDMLNRMGMYTRNNVK